MYTIASQSMAVSQRRKAVAGALSEGREGAGVLLASYLQRKGEQTRSRVTAILDESCQQPSAGGWWWQGGRGSVGSRAKSVLQVNAVHTLDTDDQRTNVSVLETR
jgi:hypothetical protein